MSKIKIVHITTQWLTTKGGPTTYVKNLQMNQSLCGYSSNIFAPDHSSDFDISARNMIIKILKIIYGLWIYSPTVIHLHGSLFYIFPSYVYKIVKLLFKIKVIIVFTFHTQPVTKSYLPGSRAKLSYIGLRGILSNIILKLVDEITAVSSSIISNLNKYTPINLKKYYVISSGAQYESVKELNVKMVKFESKSINVCSVGVFSWDWKVAGHILLIDSVKILKEKYGVCINVSIIGDGAYRAYIQDFIDKYYLRDRIKLLGYVDDPKVLFDKYDLYVHTGLNEGCSLSILEAMSSGLPVLAVNTGGNSEIITDGVTGLLFEDTPNSLACVINEVLESGVPATIAANARELILREYNWTGINKKYLALYEKGSFDLCA